MTKKTKILLSLLAAFFVLIAAFSVFIYVKVTDCIDSFYSKSVIYDKETYKLKTGKRAINVVEDLTDEFLYPEIMRVYFHYHPEFTAIQKGTYLIDGKKTLSEILTDMVQGNVLQKEYPVFTVVEGATIENIKRKADIHKSKDPLYSSLINDPSAFIKKALSEDPDLLEFIGSDYTTLEGFISPATYPLYDKDPLFIMFKNGMRLQISALMKMWDEREKSEFIKTPYDALILASLIEKETLLDEERPMISSVFYNRLKKGMKLQTDPAVMYGVNPAAVVHLTKKMLKKDTPYNTYTRAGLTPTPICMPREASIFAALHPAVSDALYFVAKSESPRDGHIFTNTLNDHNKAVAAYRKRVRDYKAGLLDDDSDDTESVEGAKALNASFKEDKKSDGN